jgi:tetratricopeptide (TPR) repeat protein
MFLAALAVVLAAGRAWAINEGQEDLDRATEAKLNANRLADLDEVVRLLQSALQKGLDEDNSRFAKSLLASSLAQRGTVRGALVFGSSPADPKLAELRKAALDDLEQAVQLDPKQPQALLLIAQLQRMPGGDVRRADEALEQCIKLSTDDPEVRKNALLLRAAVEQAPDKKLADLDEVVRLAPRHAPTIRTRGTLRADLGKFDEALVDLDKALELDPKHGPTYEVKAIVLTRLKRYDEALAALDQARQLSPNSPFPLMQQAQIHALQANLEAALRELDQAHQLDPKNVDVLRLRANIEPEPEKKAADLDEAVRLAPENTLVLRTRGLLLADQGKLDEALVDLDKAISLQPKEPANFQAKVLVLSKFKKFDDALTALERIRQITSDPLPVLLQRARLQIEKRDFQAALADLQQAHQLAPKNADVLYLRAVVHQELGQKDQALADANEVVRLAPASSVAIRFHADLLAGAGRLEEAIAELEKLRQADPKDTLALLQLASLYNARQKFAQAVQGFSAVLAEEPTQWLALRGRADALLNLGKQVEAIADYNQAIKLRPKDPGILNNLAWVLATSPDEKLRDGTRALTLATEASEVTEYKLPHILSTLAAACAETGDFPTAIKWSSKAVELGSDDQKENLKKELESYHAGKPWRELLSEGKPQPIDNQPKAATKPEEKREQPAEP